MSNEGEDGGLLEATQDALLEEMARAERAERIGPVLHRYEKIAEELGIKPEFRDDVFRLAGYDGDADPDAIREHFSEFLKRNSRFGDGGKVRVSRRDYASSDWRREHADLVGDPSKIRLVD